MRNLYFILLLAAASAHSQNFQWLKTPEINLALNPDMVGYCTAIDAESNLYVAGFKDNPYSYTTLFGDVFFNKYDADGAIQFSKTFTGRITVYAIETDPDGNVLMDIGYVNGATIGSLILSTANQGIQPLLVKFDSSGNMLWHYIPQISQSSQTAFRAMTVDSSGNIYLGLDNFMNSYILKVDSNGVPGAIITQMGTHLLSSLDTDTEGNIYAAGSCADFDSTFAGTPVPTTFLYNTWIVKYSPSGAYQWSHYISDITCSFPEVRANTPDEVYLSSDLYGAFSFGDIVAEGPMQGLFSDFFIAKLNASGEFQWVKEVIGNGVVDHGQRNYLAVDTAGNVYYAGKTRGTIAWENGLTTVAQGLSADGLLLKYDTSGNLLMAKTAGGASEDRFDSVVVNDEHEIFVSGMGRGNGTFDTIVYEGEGVESYAFAGKISSTIILGNENFATRPIRIWPNPLADHLNLSDVAIPGKVSIINMLGQQVALYDFIPGQPIDVAGLPKGVYLLKVSGNVALRFVKS